MRWSERQRAMLRTMGIRLFGPEAVTVAAPRAPVGSPPAAASAVRLRDAAPADMRPGRTSPVVLSPSKDGTTRGAPASTGEARTGVALQEIAALDWAGLRQAVASCRACALGESRQQAVFGVGHPRAHWMIVGEAPGEQEDRQGEPFVGAAGQLLDKMLRALGLTRAEGPPERQVYIANTLKCRPPKNRNPEPAESATCAPFLERQIALVQPRIILAMGRFAAQALLASTEPLGKLRGRVHAWRGVPVVVTYHPAYLLRTPADKARAWEDLCLAASRVESA
jgi:uracil-DNA glycosylase family 4